MTSIMDNRTLRISMNVFAATTAVIAGCLVASALPVGQAVFACVMLAYAVALVWAVVHFSGTRPSPSVKRQRKIAATWFVFVGAIIAITATGVSFLSSERIQVAGDTPLGTFQFALVELIMLILAYLALRWFLWRQSEFDAEFASTWNAIR